MQCQYCLANIRAHIFPLHATVCCNFKNISNGLIECKICSDFHGYHSIRKMHYHLKMKHKDTLESKGNHNDQVMKENLCVEIVQQESIEKENRTSSNSEIERSKTSIEREKASDKSGPKKQYESYQEIINWRIFELHFDSCKIYFSHMNKPSTRGYECKACPFKVSLNKGARSTMNYHLKVKHKTGKQNEKSDKECNICHEKILQRLFLSHYKVCKIYFNSMTKLSDGYKCKLCPYKNNSTQARTKIY